jgi:hypothetical protein
MREKAVADLDRLRIDLPKLRFGAPLKKAFLNPPQSPQDCTFARVTRTISADFKTVVEPCQFGGTPNCSECGCLASVGLHTLTQYQLPVARIPVGSLFEASDRVGHTVRRIREALTPSDTGRGMKPDKIVPTES